MKRTLRSAASIAVSRVTLDGVANQARLVVHQDGRDLVADVVDRDLVDAAMRDIGKSEIQDRLADMLDRPQVLRRFERDRVHQGIEIARDLAPQRRLGDRGARGSAPAGDDPLAAFVAQIEFLLRVARLEGAAKRMHQRRTEPFLLAEIAHAAMPLFSSCPARDRR